MDLAAVFPTGKIKAQLQSHKDVGKIPKPTEEFIACCSALMLEKLVHKDNPTSESVVTLEQIKAAASQYAFIQLDEVQNHNAPKATKKRRTTKTKEIQAVQQVADAVAVEPSIEQSVRVIHDEDNYDL